MSAAEIDMPTADSSPAARLMRMFAISMGNGFYVADFTNAARDEKGKLRPAYRHVRRPPTQRDFEAHLSGKLAMLAVPVDAQGNCRWGLIDIDRYGQEAVPCGELWQRLYSRKAPLLPEHSKSGSSWHLAWYSNTPLPARHVRDALSNWAEVLGFAGAEIFPKQDVLESNGSGVILPYFGGDSRETSNYAVDASNNRLTLEHWLSLTENLPPLSVPQEVDDGETGESGERVPEQAVALLVKHWDDGKRQELSFSVNGFLLSRDKGVNYCDALMDAVIARTGIKPTKYRTPQSVLRDIKKDKHVKGFPSMVQLMGEADANAFASAVGLAMDIKTEARATQAEPFPLTLIHSAADFVRLQLPAREFIVEGLLATNSLAMLAAWRGIGKTMVAMYLAVEVARSEGRFFEWSIPKPRRVLYVDGEMPAAELQERLQKFAGNEPLERLDILASEHFYQQILAPLNLADPVHQAKFLALLEQLAQLGRQPELIVLDNKSALSTGTDENSNSEQDIFLAFLRLLRHRGHTVLLVHHAGKGGDQRGASRNEDFLDLSIKLEIPKDDEDGEPYQQGDGAAFRLSFTKHRGLRPKPATLDLELMQDMDGSFTWGIKKRRVHVLPTYVRVLQYLCDHLAQSQADVVRALGIDRKNVSEAVRKLRARTMVEELTLAPTPSGRGYMDAVKRGGSTGGVQGDF